MLGHSLRASTLAAEIRGSCGAQRATRSMAFPQCKVRLNSYRKMNITLHWALEDGSTEASQDVKSTYAGVPRKVLESRSLLTVKHRTHRQIHR